VNVLYSLPYFSLIGAGVLAYWPRSIAWREMRHMDGGYDNNNPRAQQAMLQGSEARAMAAHYNCLEALPFFGLSVLSSLQGSVGIHVIVVLCLLFLLVRSILILSYLHDRPTLRSFSFLVGGGICAILYGLAACGGGNMT
jgi:uncharacterized MAPEG superfamily protein